MIWGFILCPLNLVQYICKHCTTRQQCTRSQSFQKTVTRHIWQDYLERAEDVRHSPLGKATYELRSQTIERVFADAKEKHGMRYTHHRGLIRVTNWVRLKFVAMNLKKLAMKRWREHFIFVSFRIFASISPYSHKRELSLA